VTAPRPLPIAGVRVVEFSHMVMGPSCGLVLADLGADVVKVEPLEQGDGTRRLPGSGAGFFPAFNRNKRSLALDVRTPDGLAFAKRLVARADVLTENFRPGAFEALGLGYEALRASNPRLVYCSLKGFLSGPYERRTALDEVVQMMGGLAYMTGPPGRPLRAGAPVNDMMGGMFAAIAILAALLERERTGEGQLVKSALFENTAWLVSPHMAQIAVTGRSSEPMPARTSAWAVYDVFDTADGRQIFVGVVTDTQWPKFCGAFGLPELLADPSLATNAGRVAARERFLPRLRAVFHRLTRDDAARICEDAGLPFAPIQRPDELFHDPHLATPGAMIEHGLEGGGTVRLPALPLEMHGGRLGRRLDVPRVGEHTAEIARELGYGPEAVIALAAARVLRLGPPGATGPGSDGSRTCAELGEERAARGAGDAARPDATAPPSRGRPRGRPRDPAEKA
jgi:crotonobetainyl-CoA:carnitine CoA-transferase CaiB-like acyl-CoA transferase